MKINPSRRLLILLLLIVCSAGIAAQPSADSIPAKKDSVAGKKDCVQKDVFDYIFKKRNLKLEKSKKRFSFIGIPYVAYSPVTHLQIGLGGSMSWHMGDPEFTNLSFANVSGYVTTKEQVVIGIKSNAYTDHNEWFLQGDWRFYIFNLATYGLGTVSGYAVPPIPEVQPGPDAEETTVYPMDYDWLKFHQVVSRKILRNVYAGLGYHLDYHFNIKDINLKLDTPGVIVTPHYAYCNLHGLDPEEYISSGISINGVYDTRDNIINSYKGIFVNISYRYNFKWLGSNSSGSQLWTEFRGYVSLSKRIPRHLIAFWTYGSFHVSGEIPFLDLPASGFDQMNISGRGYVQGRWRGENLVYAEAEYRFPITQCSQLLGGVLFVNATTASNKDMGYSLFETIRPAAGIGIRVMVAKKSRLNLAIDFGWGMLHSDGFYIQAQEAF